MKLLTMVFAALVAVAFVAASFATKADAHVEGVTGTASVKLNASKGAGKKLKKNKVKFSPKTLKLDVRAVQTASPASLQVKGKAVKFTARIKRPNGKTKKTNAKITITKVTFEGNKTWFDVKLGGKTIKRALSTKAGQVAPVQTNRLGFSLSNANLRIEKNLAKQLGKKLKLAKALKPGALGTGSSAIVVQTGPVVEDNPFHSVCAMDATTDLAASLGEAATPAPLPSFDPAQALAEDDGSSISWGWRASFLGYVLGNDGKFPASGGATVVQPVPVAPPSTFVFPAAGGQYVWSGGDPADQPSLTIEGSGTVILCNWAHQFAIAVENPAVVLDGDDSRLRVDVSSYVDGIWSPSRTVDLLDLDTDDVEPQYSDSGHTVTLASIPSSISAAGAEVMSALGGNFNAYEEGYPMAPVSVTAQIEQRPFEDSCVMNSFGTSTVLPNPINFDRAPLPALESPVVGTGGHANWGFRRSLRASVQMGGATNPAGPYVLFDGATASHENMGGNIAQGGLGKYFTFPGSSFAYEEGETPTDIERAVLHSNATVVLCNRTQGGYSIALSKPTFILDGANSRVVANVYASRHTNGEIHWQGGRVDVVKLDLGDIEVDQEGGFTIFNNIRVLVDGDPAVGLRTDALILGTLSPTSTGNDPGNGEEPFGWDPISISIPTAHIPL